MTMNSLAVGRWLTAAVILLFGASAADADTPTIRVQVNHAEIMRLDADAQVVHIANPAIADVIFETPRLLFVVGLAPGETGLFILDGNGEELINADLLVTPNLDHEVTLNRNAVELTYSCSPRCVATDVSALASAGTAAAGSGGPGDAAPAANTGQITPEAAAAIGEAAAAVAATMDE